MVLRPRLRWLLACALVSLSATLAQLPAAAQPGQPAARVELELVTERGFPVTGQQEWLQFLSGVDAHDVRIRSQRPGDTVAIQTRDAGGSVIHHAVGLLTAGNQLRLPGGTFRLGDRAGLNAWIAKVRSGGEENVFARRGVFGLTEKQLVGLHEKLAAPLPFQTKGQPAADVVRKINALLPLQVTVAPAVRGAFGPQELVRDELFGVSGGTALAAVVRPLGLVVVPSLQGDSDVLLQVVDVRDAQQSWPIGWPTQKSPGATLPKLFKRLNVEIADTPLDEAVAAIQQRIEAPVLYDHNSLARLDVVPSQVRVSLEPGNLYYQEILDRLLRQAGLKSELRVDEGERPLVWISGR
ncbi:MAG: hypothetical protein J5I93_03470 [Pirellulaceae bacterium]|nr:hypothetical protein [Pirellulaceae bacterium]